MVFFETNFSRWKVLCKEALDSFVFAVLVIEKGFLGKYGWKRREKGRY
jgi:hypothetical protein